MPTMSALRNCPHFAHLFARVFVLCWPILVWQINRLFNWARREGYSDILYSVNRWGFITIVYLGDRDDPHAYKPLPRTFRPLTDPGYASDLPSNLEVVPFLPREAGEVGPKGLEGVLPSPPNTS